MAITHRNSTTATSATSPTTIAKPTGTPDGDILELVVVCYDDSNNPAITDPAGWTPIDTYDVHVASGYIAKSYWRRAASEPASYAITWSGDDPSAKLCHCMMSAFPGCIATGSPIDAHSSTDYTTSNTTVRAGSVETTGTDRMLVAMASYSWDTACTFTAPGGMTEAIDANGVTMAYVAQAAQGPSGDKDFTSSRSGTGKHAFMVAFIPAATGISIPLLNQLLLGD